MNKAEVAWLQEMCRLGTSSTPAEREALQRLVQAEALAFERGEWDPFEGVRR